MHTTEQALIEQARSGDASAFGELVRLHQDRLFSAVMHIVHCSAEAEDVVQEAFVHAFRRLDSFRGESSLYSWLYRIAFNRSVSRRRRERPTQSLDQAGDGGTQSLAEEASPSHRLELQEQRSQLRQALGRLSEEHRAILVLREWEDFDYSQIADTLGVKLNTVRSRLHRARSQLRQELGNRLS